MPKAFSEHEKKVIRVRLLEQGNKQFTTHGLKKTSIEELAAAAGISKAAFYIFFESKESLFMDIVEQAENDFRREVLAVIDLPGPSARARLLAILKKAFTHWKNTPILHTFTNSDYDILFRRVAPEKLEEHLRSDREFIHELISQCQKAGIPIQANLQQISGLLYALFFTSLHEDDLGNNAFAGTFDLLLELTAAFCLGEVTTQVQTPEEGL